MRAHNEISAERAAGSARRPDCTWSPHVANASVRWTFGINRFLIFSFLKKFFGSRIGAESQHLTDIRIFYKSIMWTYPGSLLAS